jgi:hypothetical protein
MDVNILLISRNASSFILKTYSIQKEEKPWKQKLDERLKQFL